jgi:hypothetical protein
MIVEVGNASRVSLSEDNPYAGYESARILESARAAGAPAVTLPIRLIVELRRTFGGMIMRALVGGECVPVPGRVRFEVCVGAAAFDSGVPPTCESALGKALVPGLPEDFAPSVLAGLAVEQIGNGMPPGIVRVDRAGYDLMGSSVAAFYQAAMLLRTAMAATLAGDDVEVSVARRLAEIPADAH